MSIRDITPRILSGIVFASALFIAPNAIASHFRGGNIYVEVAANSNVTVTIDTLWRKTAFDSLGSIAIRNDGTTQLATFATRVPVPGCGTGDLTGWVSDGSGSSISCVNTSPDTYSIRRSVWRFRMSAAGTYPALSGSYSPNTFYRVYLTSCCRVGNIANAPESTWAMTGRFRWDQTRVSQTPRLDANITTSLFKTTAGTVPSDYSTNLGAIDPDSPLSYQFITGAVSPNYGPDNIIGSAGTQAFHPTNNTCRETNNGTTQTGPQPCGTNCPSTCPCPTCTTGMYPNLTGCYGTLAGTNQTCSSFGLASNPYVDSSWLMTVDSTGQVNLPGKTIRTMKDLTGYEQISGAGDYVYRLRVTDSTGAYSERDILLNIAKTANSPPNTPVFNGSPTGSLNQPMTLNVSASDPDAANTVTLILTNIPSWMTLSQTPGNPASATLSGTPSLASHAGTYTINADARDNGSPQLTTSSALTITVLGPNDPPVLTFVPNQGVATNPQTGALLLSSGTTLILNVSASDPNPQDTLTLSSFFGTEGNYPSGATFVQTGPGSGVFTWNVSAAHEGVWSPSSDAAHPPLSLRVRDNGTPQLADTQQVSISIGPSSNVSPSLHLYSPGTQTDLPTSLNGAEGDNFQFDLDCADQNYAQTLLVAADGTTPLPAGATLTQVSTGYANPVRYRFNWTVAAGQSGARTLQFYCRDNGSPYLQELRSVSFNIAAPTSPPTIVSVVPNQGDAAGGTVVTINGTALDGATSVRFGPTGSLVARPFTQVNDTAINFTTPAGTAGSLYDVSVTTAFGTATRQFAFQYRANADTDSDGIPDCIEGSSDPDGDSSPNISDVDSDADGISDAAERVVPVGSVALLSYVCGNVTFTIADTDVDGIADFLDLDSDDDGIVDNIEGQNDLDRDGIANYRDLDSDGDGDLDENDNCPTAANGNQADADQDGTGDVCDDDLDNDGLTNAQEAFYGTNANLADTEADGLNDYEEIFVYFTNPLVADTDGGGVNDGTEVSRGTNPRDGNDDDTVPPVITISAPSTVEATSAAGAPVSYTATAFDNVDGARPVSCSRASGSIFPFGAITVSCTASDNVGNIGNASFTVTVRDTTAPVVTVPSNITREATSAAGAAVTFSASATDNIDGAIAASCIPASGSTFGFGDTTVTCSATDAHGNSASASFTISVGDTTAPVLTLTPPAETTIEATSPAGAVVNYGATAVDNIDGPITPSCDPVSGSTFPIGSTTVFCSATDAHGNIANDDFTVLVFDGDDDADGVLNTVDNCRNVSNSGQADRDSDGAGDVCDDSDSDGLVDAVDNCWQIANADQANNDGDLEGDACDTDDDNDGVADAGDNCPSTSNSDQANNDGDGQGDVCDGDDDNDGVADAGDNCALDANADQANNDGDAEGDVCDTDDDNDGVADAGDNCALDANADQANNDGDGQGDVCDNDDDNDGVADAGDNCPSTSNSDQANNDGDAEGDLCDADDDNDGVSDAGDNCALIANTDQANNDGDAGGDLCDADDDNDDVGDAIDNCQFTANANQANNDGDADGDLCDADDDNDGTFDGTDNCPMTSNVSQADRDSDGLGDACDDSDNDGAFDANDNCATRYNPDQVDEDGDGFGNLCDNCARNANVDQADNDGDGTGNVCDQNPNVSTPSNNGAGTADPDETSVITTGNGAATVTLPPGFVSSETTVTISGLSMAPDFRVMTTGGTGGAVISAYEVTIGTTNPYYPPNGEVATVMFEIPYLQFRTQVDGHTIAIGVREPNGTIIMIPNCLADPPNPNMSADGRCTSTEVYTRPFGQQAVRVSTQAFHFSEYLLLDVTPPSITAPAGLTVEATGTNGAAASYDVTATDISDGETTVTCAPLSGSTFALGATTVTCSSVDRDNNASSTSFTVNVVDTTDPVLDLYDASAEANSVYGVVVNYTATASDISAGELVPTCFPASGSVFELGDTVVYCSVDDGHGNVADGTLIVTVVDTIAPAVTVPATITAEATGASGATVGFSASAYDVSAGDVPAMCAPASGSIFPIGATEVLCTASDGHGNLGSATFTVEVRDTTAPVVTVPADIAAIANTAAGRAVAFATSASDLVDGSVAVSCTPASGSVFAPGATVVRCHATDAAGNRSADRIFTVTVTISWSGVLQPVNTDGSSVFKRGRIVPVKFDVTGASAAITNGVFRLYYAQVSGGVVGEINEAESTSVGNVDNIFKHTGGGRYHYNLSTDDMPQGTYVLRFDLGDGVIHDAYIGLRN